MRIAQGLPRKSWEQAGKADRPKLSAKESPAELSRPQPGNLPLPGIQVNCHGGERGASGGRLKNDAHPGGRGAAPGPQELRRANPRRSGQEAIGCEAYFSPFEKDYPWGLFEKCQHAQSTGLLPPGRRNFSLKSVRIPAKKLLASGPKSLAAGYIAKFQPSPRQARMETRPPTPAAPWPAGPWPAPG